MPETGRPVNFVGPSAGGVSQIFRCQTAYRPDPVLPKPFPKYTPSNQARASGSQITSAFGQSGCGLYSAELGKQSVARGLESWATLWNLGQIGLD